MGRLSKCHATVEPQSAGSDYSNTLEVVCGIFAIAKLVRLSIGCLKHELQSGLYSFTVNLRSLCIGLKWQQRNIVTFCADARK